jgi:hypothetical protein
MSSNAVSTFALLARTNAARPRDRAATRPLVGNGHVTGGYAAMRTLSMWLFRAPVGAVSNLPAGVPAAASAAPARTPSVRQSQAAAGKVRLTTAISDA